jgi:isoleucyl-tRNA synthetase
VNGHVLVGSTFDAAGHGEHTGSFEAGAFANAGAFRVEVARAGVTE